jgi:hypothetical protein
MFSQTDLWLFSCTIENVHPRGAAHFQYHQQMEGGGEMTVYEALNLLNGFGHLIATVILVVMTMLSKDKK